MRAHILAAAIFAIFTTTAASAAEPAPADRPYGVRTMYKFTRGLTNIVASPTEIYINMYKEGHEAQSLSDSNWADIGVGTFVGMFQGIGYMVARIGVGVADVLTFPVPTEPFMHPKTPDLMLESQELRSLSTPL
jgi:putative exosortase-associated protein (TIGR04073 family)